MSFFTALGVEFQKIRRSKILLILLIPVVIMWIPSIVNARINFDTRNIPITPENNFFIQGFMGMVWFIIPASLVICTVLLTQTERSQRGILKMLSLPVSIVKLCLAKFLVLVILSLVQMLLAVCAYYISAAAASQLQHYDFVLKPDFVFPVVLRIYLAAIPMAAVFWMLAVLIQTPVFAAGAGLVSIVPSVLIINTKLWFLYPISYPFYLLMIEYGKVAQGVYETEIQWLPWIPAAIVITIAALAVSCIRFGAAERR